MSDISVIIPTWNGEKILKDCLNSLLEQTYQSFEVIVVDNNSTDGTLDMMEKFYPQVKVVQLQKNYGFAKAINVGVRQSNSKYVAFLNNDTVVDKDWIKELLDCIKRHSDAASVGCKILNFYERDILDGVGIEISEVGHGRSLGWGKKDVGQYDREVYIFGATGGACLFVRDIFVELGMFDEDFFMYYEEVDLAFRAQFKGWRSVLNPRAVVYHRHKHSSRKFSQKLEYWQFKNMTQMIVKNYSVGICKKKWRWAKIFLVHLNTIFYQIKSGYIWPPLMVELWLITHIFSLLKKRALVLRDVNVSDEYIESFMRDKKIRLWGLRR